MIVYSSSGGLVFDRNQFLLIKRLNVSEWRIPKGHIEPGESAEQAALREVTEETGYSDLEVLADLGTQLNQFEREGSTV